ncbi:conjugal transfer protein [Enterococcus sp. LJL51]|uniref:conjugal transfer protein n=1 Tax=Enterococcus sp. LJL51 TaxID=3416656 RepID=UPI003CF08F73
MKYYDYSRGLKAPYSIQVIKSPKGKVIWVFSQSISLSYFLVMFAGWVLFFVIGQFFRLPVILDVDLNLMVFIYVPHRLARWYSETDIDGKSGVAYIKDFLVYVKDFVIDNREIYRFERVSEEKEFTFRR